MTTSYSIFVLCVFNAPRTLRKQFRLSDSRNIICIIFYFLQGINPEAVDRLLVRKPKTSSRSGIKSTLYRAYTGDYIYIWCL